MKQYIVELTSEERSQLQHIVRTIRIVPQICLDETSKQLVAESRPSLPMRPGQCEREDPEYRRCGVTRVFMLSESLAGKRHVRVRSRRTKVDFAEVIRECCDELYPDTDKDYLGAGQPEYTYNIFVI